MERLTTKLEDGSIEILRELAGGERKVGAYLSQLTVWLWTHQEQLESAPLSDFTLIKRADLKLVLELQEGTDYEALTKQIHTLRLELDKSYGREEVIERRLTRLEEVLSKMTPERLDELNESARQHDLVLIELMFNMLSDEQVEEYLATNKENGEYFAGRMAELGEEKVAELKARGRSKERRKAQRNVTAGVAK